MSNQDDVRRIALSLPGVTEVEGRFAFNVDHQGKAKGFVWVWQERVHPKKARVPQPAVLAVRVAGPDDKAALLAADPAKFFTEPHYDGFPAVLVRLAAVDKRELRKLIVEAWRCQAPREDPVAAYIAAQPAAIQPVLTRMRDAIRKAMPDAEEAISYHIPTYKLGGRAALYFAAWKAHVSLYPAGPALVAAFRKELAAYEVEKGTIRFPLAKPVPVKLIGRIAKFVASAKKRPKA